MTAPSKILVTGGTGFLGGAMVSEFTRKGVKPRVLVRKDSRTGLLDSAGFDKVTGDLGDARSLAAAVDGMETVVHGAAITGSSDPAENLRVNFEGTKNLISACKDRGVKRIVGVSTISADIRRRGAYGDSKLMADNLLLACGLDVTIIRATLMFGPGSRQIESIKRFVTMLPWMVPVIGDGRYRVQPVSVEDVARVVVAAALNRPTRRFYHVGGPEQITFDEMLTRVMTRLGIRKRLIHSPYFLVHTALSIAGKYISRLPINAAQVSTLCQDGVCPVKETERDFNMTFTPFDRVLEKMPA